MTVETGRMKRRMVILMATMIFKTVTRIIKEIIVITVIMIMTITAAAITTKTIMITE